MPPAPDSSPAALGPTVAVVLKGYPRLSETFIAQELLALERRGFDLLLYSLRHPTDPAVHPLHREIHSPVDYLPEYLKDEPGRVWLAWSKCRLLPGYGAARRAFLADLRRDPTPNRLRRFGQGCVLAAELPEEVSLIYAHFLHTPASVARYAALIRGLPWSVSAHAKDIWTTPDWEKREKLESAAWAVTCTHSGAEHLRGLTPAAEVELVYHGLDLARFGAPGAAPAGKAARDGRDPAQPVRLLSVGRAVPKKGYELLLRALADLPAGLNWRLDHVGGGALLDRLKAEAARLGIAERIAWHGPQPQDRVLTLYRQADLFVLASRIADDGDRDGLPNVLLEAQSQGVACLATRVSAIPELIAGGETGVLVPPDDVAALGAALAALIGEPARREALGQAGQARVVQSFGMARGIERLADRLTATALRAATAPAGATAASPSAA